MASKTFDPPFAGSGDKTAIPDATQPSGAMSYTDGFTLDYELDQDTEPTAKEIPREETNQLYFDITEFLQEIQQNGLSIYDASYDYAVGAHTIASDGTLYRALLVNGPASTVRNPVGDTSGSWLSNRGDMVNYVATFDYVATDYSKGSDGFLYRCAIANGPSTSVVNPVGDATGTWALIGSANPSSMTSTVFTASDPVWAPTAGVRSIKVFVTGGGGGGGGVDFNNVVTWKSGAGGAGGTAIATLNAPFDATYAIVVGALGAGGPADGAGSNGSTGGQSLFKAVAGEGGIGGNGSESLANVTQVDPGVAGGTASGGDLNLAGGAGGPYTFEGPDNTLSSLSVGGDSYWGGGAAATLSGDGTDADAGTWGAGGGGAGIPSCVGDLAGGDGAPGVVVVEEYF